MRSILRENKFHIGSILLIIASIVIVYANSIGGDFVSDDRPMILNNIKITSFSYVPEYFTKGVWNSSELNLADPLMYRPLHLVSIALNYYLWGEHAFGYHLFNIMIHIANSILVFFLIRSLAEYDSIFPALVAAVCFALTPLHVESVSWISGVTDVLATFFFLTAFLSYRAYALHDKTSAFVSSVILFICAVLSKETAIVFIPVVFLYDYLVAEKLRIARLSAYIIVGAAYLLTRSLVLTKVSGILSLSGQGMTHLVSFFSHYIKLLVLPWPLPFYFVLPKNATIGLGTILFSVCLIGALIYYTPRNKRTAFCHCVGCHHIRSCLVVGI